MVLWLCLTPVSPIDTNPILKIPYRAVQPSPLVRSIEKSTEFHRRVFLANIQFNERHYNEVIRVLPLRTTR